jgi:hypothetical protein
MTTTKYFMFVHVLTFVNIFQHGNGLSTRKFYHAVPKYFRIDPVLLQLRRPELNYL